MPETTMNEDISGSEKELYFALLSLVKEEAKNRGINEGKKKLYYISAELLS